MNAPDRTPLSPTIVGLLAERLRMTEGQLYTVVLAALAVLLMTLTGLPNAHQNGNGITLSGSSTTVPTVVVAP